MNERKRKRSRDVTRVLRERTDGGTENPTPPLGLTDRDRHVYTVTHPDKGVQSHRYTLERSD